MIKKVVCALGMFLFTATLVQANHIVIGSRGGVDVMWVPQSDPGAGFSAGMIALKTTDENAVIVTLEKLSIEGNLVQTWLSGPFGTPTAKGEPLADATYPAEWIPYDSHLMIDESQVGGGAGGSYGGISETNDGTIGHIAGLPEASGYPPISGFGAIETDQPADAFFLRPEYHSDSIDLAYVVIPSELETEISLSLGVLGEGFVNSGDPGGANWGFGDNPVAIHFVPEPSALLLGALAAFGTLLVRSKRRAAA